MLAPTSSRRPGHDNWLRERGSQPFGHGQSVVRVTAGQDDGEFVTTQAGDGIARPHGTVESVGDLLEHDVAHGVPKGVVDILEAIEVQEQQCQQRTVVFRSGESAVKSLV